MSLSDSICILSKDIKSKRVSSYSRGGGNDDYIKIDAHETIDIAKIQGAGYIRHIWITMNSEDPMIRRNTIIRMFWDNEKEASVESPLGDFFGQGWGEEYILNTLLLAASPKKGKALNCYFSMPYANSAVIQIENQSDKPITHFYFYVDYEVHPFISEGTGRFHAWWNREITKSHPGEGESELNIAANSGNNTTDRNNYLFAEIEGCGKFIGINYYVENPDPCWYGEGDDMWLIDGEPWPGSLHGTGTEDFFNCAWCPNEVFMHPYFGYARVPCFIGWLGRTHCYRFFIDDPIYFSKSLRASIEHGHNNNLNLDLCSVAYWYQTEPHMKFIPLPSREERQNMPRIGATDIHHWRHAFIKSCGSKKDLWGNEWRYE